MIFQICLECTEDVRHAQGQTILGKRGSHFFCGEILVLLQKLVRNMEFLAAHGPLRMLDHEGRNLNFAQYYLIDVVLFIVIVTILVLCSIGLACFASCRFCYWKVRRCTYESLKKE